MVPLVGAGYMHTKFTIKDSAHNVDRDTLNKLKKFAKKNANQLQPRVGIGLSYELIKNLIMATDVSYQMANNNYNNVTTAKIGFILNF
jgi:outer membrane protein W